MQYYSSSRVRVSGIPIQIRESCTGGRLSGIRARCTINREISIPAACAAWPILSHSLSGAMTARCLRVLLRSKSPGKREVKGQHTSPDNGNKKNIYPTLFLILRFYSNLHVEYMIFRILLIPILFSRINYEVSRISLILFISRNATFYQHTNDIYVVLHHWNRQPRAA